MFLWVNVQENYIDIDVNNSDPEKSDYEIFIDECNLNESMTKCSL